MTARLQSLNMMDVLAENVSVTVNVYDGFATVHIDLGGSAFSLFTTNEDEAKAIVAKFLMPKVNDRTIKAPETV